LIAIYSDFDAYLAPIDAAYCPGALNIEVRAVGHFHLLTSRKIFRLIRENLDAPPVPHDASSDVPAARRDSAEPSVRQPHDSSRSPG
jgi:hypothetical protein